LWHFVVQREACGLRDFAYVVRDYRVPREVAARMGAMPSGSLKDAQPACALATCGNKPDMASLVRHTGRFPMRFEGYAIISEDGMIADTAGHMPAVLTVEADQIFFQASLDRAAVVVHGRHSHEGGPARLGAQTPDRHNRALLVSHRIPCTAAAYCGIRPQRRLAQPYGPLGIGDGTVAVIGGADVYECFGSPAMTSFI
jgi:dihydrofolate reductase